MRSTYLLVLMAFNVFWGGTYAAFKDLKNWLTPGQVVTLRFGIAAIMLAAAWPFMPGLAPRGRDLLKTIVMGVIVFVCAPRLQVYAAHHGQAGDLSVLVALEPLVVTLGAALILHEHVPARRWLGFAFGMLGAVLLSNIWQSDFRFASLAANLIFIASFFCESAYSVMGKRLIERAGFLKVTTIALLAGVIINLAWDGPSTIAAAKHLPMRGWIEILLLASICTAIGYTVWFAAMKHVPVNVIAMTVFIQPFAGAALAVALLGEKLHIGQLWGGLAILIGLALGLRRTQNAAPTPEAKTNQSAA
jgi:drug/metabolite transporter (DMT)-like permease